MRTAFLYHCLRRDISNFSLLKHRSFDGFLISMHQSGTHWLKHILATALTRKYDLPPPEYIHANDVIAGPKDPRPHEELPHLVSSHSIPHLLLYSRITRRFIKFPPHLILIRDIRATLVSNYEKWKQHYNCDFDSYLRGDISGKKFNSDIWWCIRFCNSWGKIADTFPHQTRVVKYEELKNDTFVTVQTINQYWGLGLSDDLISYAIEDSSKEKMLQKKDPDTPFGVDVVRADKTPYLDWFDNEQKMFVRETCNSYLKYDFDYQY